MYNKIFTKILDSSIWLEPDATRIVWLTCIAAMDEDGFVQFASVANLAHRANVSLEAAQAAVTTLEDRDPNSSNPDHDGRRLERVPGGWIVLNAKTYRELVTRVAHLESNRRRVAKHRESKRVGNDVKQKRNASVMQSEAVSVSGSEATTKAKEEVKEEVKEERRPLLPKGGSAPLPIGTRRFKVWRWMIDDLLEKLGPHAEKLNLEDWFLALDARDSAIIPPKKSWEWLQQEFYAEVERRGIPVGSDRRVAERVEDRRSPYGSGWECRHTPRCGNRTTCAYVTQKAEL